MSEYRLPIALLLATLILMSHYKSREVEVSVCYRKGITSYVGLKTLAHDPVKLGSECLALTMDIDAYNKLERKFVSVWKRRLR